MIGNSGDVTSEAQMRLRTWRNKRALSMDKAAQRLNLSKAMLCRLETGSRTPGLRLAVELQKRGPKIRPAAWFEPFDISRFINAEKQKGTKT